MEPTYQATPGATWFHFLHGNVPGHQIDFMFRPDVPQGALTRQHFSHLARFVKYIEPRRDTEYAFAIANMSRDDTQYEPGHGCVALIFGLRVHGALDHAGRQDPPFCHAIACVDRHLDAAALLEASVRFYEQLLAGNASTMDGRRFYQRYVSLAGHSDWAIRAEMQAYMQAFERLPMLEASDLALRWSVEGVNVPKRVVVVYPDQTPFPVLAQRMAEVAGVLIESDIRWTAITTGREQDLLGGTTVRFVPEREAVQEPPDVVLVHIDQLPLEPRDIAEQLFGAQEVRLSQTQSLRLKWRNMAEQGKPEAAEVAHGRPWAKPPEEPEKPIDVERPVESSDGLTRPHVQAEGKRKRRRGFLAIVVTGVMLAMLGLVVALVVASQGPPVPAPAAPVHAPSAAPTVAESTTGPAEMVAPSQTGVVGEPVAPLPSALAAVEEPLKPRKNTPKVAPTSSWEKCKRNGFSVTCTKVRTHTVKSANPYGK